jgi:hypothetical protein
MDFLTLNVKKYTPTVELYAGPDRDVEIDKEVVKQPQIKLDEALNAL